MNAKTIYSILLVIHILSVVGILAILLSQIKKSPRKLSPGLLHSGLTALLAGLIMIGLFKNAYPDEVLNHTKIGIKLLVLLVILGLGYANVKKEELKKSVWLTMIGLTIFNIAVASGWK